MTWVLSKLNKTKNRVDSLTDEILDKENEEWLLTDEVHEYNILLNRWVMIMSEGDSERTKHPYLDIAASYIPSKLSQLWYASLQNTLWRIKLGNFCLDFYDSYVHPNMNIFLYPSSSEQVLYTSVSIGNSARFQKPSLPQLLWLSQWLSLRLSLWLHPLFCPQKYGESGSEYSHLMTMGMPT